MFPDMTEIKRKRKLLGLTQKELANLADVSQSVITKIEKGAINPSYTLVAKIFLTLEQIERKNEKTAKELMTSPYISVKPNDTLLKATKKMEKHAFSQLPVINEQGVCIGSISDQTILKLISAAINDREQYEKITQKQIKEVMSDPFPTITEQTPLKVLSSLLEFVPAILVTTNEGITGIITRADLFKTLRK